MRVILFLLESRWVPDIAKRALLFLYLWYRYHRNLRILRRDPFRMELAVENFIIESVLGWLSSPSSPALPDPPGNTLGGGLGLNRNLIQGGVPPTPKEPNSASSGVAPAPEAEKGGKGDRLVLLNAFPISMLPWEEYPGERRWINVYLVEVTPDELKWAVDDAVKSGTPILCYIRHPSTVRVLSDFLGVSLQPSAGLYKWRKGDRVYIVALKRPVRGADVEVSMDDLRIISCGIDVRW